jgi:hypothetical protein
MKFCPFRSTSEKEVECDENCMLYCKMNDDKFECGINYLAECLEDNTDKVGYLANALWNK